LLIKTEYKIQPVTELLLAGSLSFTAYPKNNFPLTVQAAFFNSMMP
jgi:hypothetical protein